MITCNGCGIELDYDDQAAIGYAYEKNKDGLCQRCYRLKHFNESPQLSLTSVEYRNIFESIVKEKQLIIWVIDIFDFSASYLEYIQDELQDLPVLIIANKVDILPKSVNLEKITDWIKGQINGKLKVENILVTSAIKNFNIDQLLAAVRKTGYKTAYFIGTTNVGKSTIINKLVKSINPESTDQLTTSYYAGTTLGKVEIIVDQIQFYDTPGIINDEQIGNRLTKESLKIILPQKELRPTTFQLDSLQTLFITGLCQINYLQGNCASFTCYAANQVEVHRTNYLNAEQIRTKHYGETLLQVPNELEIDNFPTFKTVKLSISQDSDIAFSGLAFVAIKGIKQTVEVEIVVPEFMGIEVRKNII